jgi:hypothetical protein
LGVSSVARIDSCNCGDGRLEQSWRRWTSVSCYGVLVLCIGRGERSRWGWKARGIGYGDISGQGWREPRVWAWIRAPMVVATSDFGEQLEQPSGVVFRVFKGKN